MEIFLAGIDKVAVYIDDIIVGGSVTADLVLSWNGPRTDLGSLFWSGGLKQALPETVLGPFQAACFGPTLLILVLHLGPFQAAHFGPTLTKDWFHINLKS